MPDHFVSVRLIFRIFPMRLNPEFAGLSDKSDRLCSTSLGRTLLDSLRVALIIPPVASGPLDVVPFSRARTISCDDVGGGLTM